jgi:aryl-alcohol dehydrogenase-like predicted oxidoreductase
VIDMSNWLEERVKLGTSGLYAGRLGMGAAYGAPAAAWEAAFDAGCNLFYWGALRNKKMAVAIRNLVSQGKREQMLVMVQAFRRTPAGIEKSLHQGLKKLGLEFADILLLGWRNKPLKEKLLEHAVQLQKQGMFRVLGVSGHNRPLFPQLAQDPRFGLFMLRYNAAHRGAEEDIFPYLPEERPGIVAFTATRHMSLVNSKKIPAGEKRPTAVDCYRFVLSNPHVDVVITGPKNEDQMRQNLAGINQGPLNEDEMVWMRRIGDYVYGKKRAN